MAPSDRPAEPRSHSFVEAVCYTQPYYALLIGLLPGFALIFGSFLLHIASWKAAPPPPIGGIVREVGYLPALNWSLTYGILFPVLLYLMTNTISGLADALDSLHKFGMVRQKHAIDPVREPLLTSSWLAGTQVRARLIMVFAVLIPIAFGLTEWFLNNLLRLIHMSSVPSASDYDWGLAGIMPLPGHQEWTLTLRLANSAFDLVAFMTEIFLISSLMAFFLAVLDLGRVIPSGRRSDSLELVPDLHDNDRRLGFEVFALPLENLFGVALVAYLICYLVRLQGAYMASSNATNLADFVSADILSGIKQAATSLSRSAFADVLSHLFDLGEQQMRGVLAWMMSVLIAIFSLATVVITARGAALAAQTNTRRKLDDGSLGLTGIDKETASKKLDSMVIWPLGYLKLDTLVFWVTIAVLTLILYRIGLFMAGIVFFSLFFRFIKGLVQPGKSPTAPVSAIPNGG